MKRILVVTFLLFLFVSGYAQDLMLGQYVFYRDALNPSSYVQSNDVNVFVLYNNEFSGFEQQPNSQIADVSVMVHDFKIGLSVINDIVGYDKTQNIKMRLAKQFGITDKSFFSLGLAAGVINRKMEATKMTFENEGDPQSYFDYTNTNMDFDFGAEFQSEKLIVGLSVNHLGKQISNAKNENPIAHYYGYAQYKLSLDNAFYFYPNTLVRKWQNTFYGEMGLQAFYKNKVWLGSSFSNDYDLMVNAGMRIKQNIMFGYAFRTNMNSKILSPLVTNRHEIFLNFAINGKHGNMKSVRFVD